MPLQLARARCRSSRDLSNSEEGYVPLGGTYFYESNP